MARYLFLALSAFSLAVDAMPKNQGATSIRLTGITAPIPLTPAATTSPSATSTTQPAVMHKGPFQCDDVYKRKHAFLADREKAHSVCNNIFKPATRTHTRKITTTLEPTATLTPTVDVTIVPAATNIYSGTKTCFAPHFASHTGIAEADLDAAPEQDIDIADEDALADIEAYQDFMFDEIETNTAEDIEASNAILSRPSFRHPALKSWERTCECADFNFNPVFEVVEVHTVQKEWNMKEFHQSTRTHTAAQPTHSHVKEYNIAYGKTSHKTPEGSLFTEYRGWDIQGHKLLDGSCGTDANNPGKLESPYGSIACSGYKGCEDACSKYNMKVLQDGDPKYRPRCKAISYDNDQKHCYLKQSVEWCNRVEKTNVSSGILVLQKLGRA